jgi:microsomal triglyceride transfer protein large subunit
MMEYLKSSDRAFEVKQYLIQKLRLTSEKCSQFKEMVRMSLVKDPEVNNWNIYGGLKGLSTALERRFSQQPSFNGSLLSIQEMKGGVLKRGAVDLLMRSKDDEMSLFSLGIFAGGLSSFITSNEVDDEVDPNEDTTATAGMELAIQGVQMRPLTFFKGQGELMGHVWSGTASEPTSAYKGSTLLQDHKQVVALNNGALLDFSALGAISIDLNGKMEISLWYKNANSEIAQK